MAKGKKTGGGTRSGRPNKVVKEVKLLAQQYTSEAVERLAHWMRSEDPTASVKAATALLDRGHGKPAQPVKVDGHLSTTSDRASQIRDKLRARGAPPPVAGTIQ